MTAQPSPSAVALAELLKENEQLREAIYWALGERDSIGDEPPPLAGKYRRRFWWRAGLRERAGAALSADRPAPPATRWQEGREDWPLLPPEWFLNCILSEHDPKKVIVREGAGVEIQCVIFRCAKCDRHETVEPAPQDREAPR